MPVVINSSANSAGNIRFTAANPSVVASSYIIVPGGAYFNSGTVYFEAQAQLRGGIHNDTGAYLTIAGGTSGITYVTGNLGIGTTGPAEQVHATGNIRADGIVYWGNGLVRTETKDDPGLMGSQGARSGFFETSNPVAANFYPNVSGWQHYFETRHSNNGNNFAFQIAGSFFDQDFWFRKTNNAGNTEWSQLIGAGNRTCTAPFNSLGVVTPVTVGGITRRNTICATIRLSGLNFNDAQNVCYALGGHIGTYNETYRLAQTYGLANVVGNGDWIGSRAGDDQAYCVNNTTTLNNFEGVCDKENVRTYRCVNSSTNAQ
ncbi:hypothetical protein A7982_13194 [Minicystis rosea]|nr:hypothetical protein A7982_13194 [Minicystis rosea]